MANTVFANAILETQFKDLLNTKLNTKTLMKIDTNLQATDGMKVKVNKYTYSGSVESLAAGTGSTESARGKVVVASTDYTANLYQQAFDYTDEDFMTDGNVVEAGMSGATQVMVNNINTLYFAELANATLSSTYANGSTLGYDDVVDAISVMNVEDEANLALIIGLDMKAAIRKDDDFKSSKLGEVLYTGQIGTISGIPVVCSKLVPDGTAYIADKAAVTLFVKKDGEIEQGRDADKRTNSIYMREVAIVALTDATRVVKITEAEAETETEV